MSKVTDEQIIEACNSSKTNAEASRKLGLSESTVRRRAKELGCYCYKKKDNLSEEEKENFKKVCEESQSMDQAAKELNLKWKPFKRIAEELGCFNPNQSGEGTSKNRGYKVKMEDILTNKVTFSTNHLKKRLIKEGYKENKCEVCGITHWNDIEIVCELHHKDGNKHNNNLDNLQMICPNCHSQTDTFRGKNI